MRARLRRRIDRFLAVPRYLLMGDCGMICEYQEPYGFVPEAGCPVHDGWYKGLGDIFSDLLGAPITWDPAEDAFKDGKECDGDGHKVRGR